MGKKDGKKGKFDATVENAEPNLPIIMEEDRLERSAHTEEHEHIPSYVLTEQRNAMKLGIKKAYATEKNIGYFYPNGKGDRPDPADRRKSTKSLQREDRSRPSVSKSDKNLKSKSILKHSSNGNVDVAEGANQRSKTKILPEHDGRKSLPSVQISLGEDKAGEEKKEKGKKGKKSKKEAGEESKAKKPKKEKKEKPEGSSDDDEEEDKRLKKDKKDKSESKVKIVESVTEIKSKTIVHEEKSRETVAEVGEAGKGEKKGKKGKKDQAEQAEDSEKKAKKGKKEKKGKEAKASKETQKDDEDEGDEQDSIRILTKTDSKLRPYSKVSFHSKTILADRRKSSEQRSETMIYDDEKRKMRRASKGDSRTSMDQAYGHSASRARFRRKSSLLTPERTGSGRRLGRGHSSSRLSTDTDYSDTSSFGSGRVEKEEHGKKKKKGKKDKKGKKRKEEKDEDGTEKETPEEKERKKAEMKELKEKEKAEKDEAKREAAAAAPKKPKGEKPPETEYEETKRRLDELKKIAKEMGIEELKDEVEEKGPKKKLSKKEKAKLTAEMAEKQRLEMEAQAKKMEELIKKRKEEERLAAIERDKKDTMEQGLRMEQLKASNALIQDITDTNAEIARTERENLEWKKYVECGNLPNPMMVDQMNTYLHLWGLILEETSMDVASQKTTDAIKLLNDLDELIDIATKEDENKMENWKWVRQLFREYQASSLDLATYRLLRDVEHNLNRINIPTADFNFKDDHVTLCIWLRVMLPIPLPNPRRPPKPKIDIFFSSMDMSVQFPLTIDCQDAAIRAMYLKYDHLSDLSDTFDMHEVPSDYHMDLLSLTKKEWRTQLKYKYDHRDRIRKLTTVQEVQQEGGSSPEHLASAEQKSDGQEKPEVDKTTVEDEEPTDFASDEEIPIVIFKQLKPTSNDYAVEVEDNMYSATREKLRVEVPEHIINLRRFVILGGVYYLNLLAQPPQPQDFITMEMTITRLFLPKKLEVLPFKVVYTPYVPPPEPEPTGSSGSIVRKLPEEIEEESKKQEEELDKLIAMHIKWPQHVIFLELPIVCRWDEEKKQWSKEEIHDLKHNEEKGILSFRTGVFGIYGLATYRYVNLPFQVYDIKPEIDESVTIQLTLAMLMMEFNIKDGLVSIIQLQNSPNNTLQDVVGKYFKLHKLKRMMKDAGLDIFPSFDAFCYLDGCCEKHWPMEQHLYFNMAQMSNSFNFSWSRWNLQAGRRKIVLQMRPYSAESKKQKSHQMLMVTPLKAAFIECTEVSQLFSDKEVESLKFSADLYHLMKSTSGIFVRNKVMKASKQNVYALAQFLKATRVLSFS